MEAKRKIEVFSAGCPVCEEAIALIRRISCPSCEILIRDMQDPGIARQAKELGIRSIPAVVIDGRIADCCAGKGPDEHTLKACGVGQPL